MKRIYITGPECSGKSTLASSLSKHFGCPLVPEFARAYLSAGAGPYTIEDLTRIAAYQRIQQDIYESLAHDIVVCDTGPLVLKVWAHEKFGVVPQQIDDYLKITPELVILCKPDFAWSDDPLRENPTDRDRLFRIYKDVLKDLRWTYHIAEGTKAEREQKCIRLIKDCVILS